jgi:hypothetical protein
MSNRACRTAAAVTCRAATADTREQNSSLKWYEQILGLRTHFNWFCRRLHIGLDCIRPAPRHCRNVYVKGPRAQGVSGRNRTQNLWNTKPETLSASRRFGVGLVHTALFILTVAGYGRQLLAGRSHGGTTRPRNSHGDHLATRFKCHVRVSTHTKTHNIP